LSNLSSGWGKKEISAPLIRKKCSLRFFRVFANLFSSQINQILSSIGTRKYISDHYVYAVAHAGMPITDCLYNRTAYIKRTMSSSFHNRVKWVGTTSAASILNGDALPPPSNGDRSGPLSQPLTVDTAAAEADHATSFGGTGLTAEQNPTTPPGVRGNSDFRSPGVNKTPTVAGGLANDSSDEPPKGEESFIPDFVTQTDRHGNATTPRSAEGIQIARRMHPTGPEPNLRVERGVLVQDGHEATAKGEGKEAEADADAYESILDGFRMMCCCLLPEESNAPPGVTTDSINNDPVRNSDSLVGYSTRGHDAPLLFEEDSALRNGDNPDKVKLLPNLHHDDHGKKCLVLDLDETLVHSSFRAVPGADFVIPVQVRIESILFLTKESQAHFP
jgi:hypothetical protein